MPPVLDALRAQATLGEIVARSRTVFGRYRERSMELTDRRRLHDEGRRPPGAAHERNGYRATLDGLDQLRRFGMRPGVEGSSRPSSRRSTTPGPFRAIHVTGSKGKGSVSVMAAGSSQSTGRTVGLYTSPHLVSYRERIRVNGRPIPRRAVVEGVERVQGASRRLLEEGRADRPATFFEVTTALAFDWFRARHVQDAVVEVGIGGRLDATNVLDALVGVIVTIELEHTDVLGPTLSATSPARRQGSPRGMVAVVGEPAARGPPVVDRIADSLGVSLWHLGEEVRRANARSPSSAVQRFPVTPSGPYPRRPRTRPARASSSPGMPRSRSRRPTGTRRPEIRPR